MKRLWLFFTASLTALAAAPAFAQQGPGNPDYGYGHMSGWGWHSGMIFGPFVMLLVIVALVVLVAGVGWFGHHGYRGRGFCPNCGHRRDRGALDLLEERFAKGEIDKAEFEEKRKLLGR